MGMSIRHKMVNAAVHLLSDFQGPGRTGTIGDRQVILHTIGDTGGPIIDVIKVVERSDSTGRKGIFGKITDRIIYENWSH